MMMAISTWWRDRTPREQGLLALLAIVALPILIWYGIIRPLDRAIDAAQASRDADERMLADVLLMAGKVQAAHLPARVGRAPIDRAVEVEAGRAGFTIASVSRDGEGALLTMDAVRAQPLFAWLAEIKQRRGLIVTRLNARPNEDATLSASIRFEHAR